jgi:2C-methyl-D-erythritol 2,4-cyclodiphosphate synthase
MLLPTELQEKEHNMNNDSEYIIGNIDFTMTMEDMPLTEENKEEMRKCIDGKLDLDKLIEETISKYMAEAV